MGDQIIEVDDASDDDGVKEIQTTDVVDLAKDDSTNDVDIIENVDVELVLDTDTDLDINSRLDFNDPYLTGVEAVEHNLEMQTGGQNQTSLTPD